MEPAKRKVRPWVVSRVLGWDVSAFGNERGLFVDTPALVDFRNTFTASPSSEYFSHLPATAIIQQPRPNNSMALFSDDAYNTELLGLLMLQGVFGSCKYVACG